jgi:hypothetical protein
MRLRLLVAAGAAAALAVPFAAHADSAPYLVTGGGQVIASSGDAGPGDTVAFVARLGEDGTAQGSLQFLTTSEARDGQRPSVMFNGQVTCVEPGGDNTARFGGYLRAGNGPQAFTVDVTDASDGETDLISVRETGQPCQDEGTQLNGQNSLSRGNVTVDTASSGR